MNIYDDIEQHNSTLSQIIAICLVSNFNINRSIEHYTTIPLFQFFFKSSLRHNISSAMF